MSGSFPEMMNSPGEDDLEQIHLRLVATGGAVILQQLNLRGASAVSV